MSPLRVHTQPTEQYESVISEALAEFDAGRWVEALTLFVRAKEIYPIARVLRGNRMASFEVRDYAAAVQVASTCPGMNDDELRLAPHGLGSPRW